MTKHQRTYITDFASPIEGEQWKEVCGYANYQVSNLGRVKNRNGWLLRPTVMTNGYKKVSCRANGASKIFLVHRLVAQTFLPNPNNYPNVHHINKDISDNRAENLEWISVQKRNDLRTTKPTPSVAGTKWWNNGKVNARSKECPEGFVAGRLPIKGDNH